jgi:hypothetical protein
MKLSLSNLRMGSMIIYEAIQKRELVLKIRNILNLKDQIEKKIV